MKPHLIAAALATALGFASAASAATFTVTPGAPFVLGGDYDPNPGAPDIAAGATVVRNGALALADRGRVTFSYFGTEAGYANEFWVDGIKRFDNKSRSNAAFTLKFDAGVLPFEFRTANPAGGVTNGGSTGYHKSIALYQTTPTTVYALFNDASTSDKDYDDMVVRMDVAPVPLPAAAWLLVGGIAGLGAISRRRRAGA
jgi:hypothetical protein